MTPSKFNRRVVVGFSGGVTSAWSGWWALNTYPRDEVIFLWHDTKEEDPDTYRFVREMADRLNHSITERSDGRSVTEVCRDEGALANNRMAFCSRILKAEQRDKYFAELRASGITEILNVLGFTAIEWQRIQRAWARGQRDGYECVYPLVDAKMTKQHCIDWCVGLGVKLPRMYAWSEHANCLGCVRGGKAYWLAVKENAPDVFAQRIALEAEFGHTILKDTSLENLTTLKRRVNRREQFEVPCECVG